MAKLFLDGSLTVQILFPKMGERIITNCSEKDSCSESLEVHTVPWGRSKPLRAAFQKSHSLQLLLLGRCKDGVPPSSRELAFCPTQNTASQPSLLLSGPSATLFL